MTPGNNGLPGKGAGKARTISFSDVSLLARVAALCGFDIGSVLSDVGIGVSDVQDEGAHGDLELITTLMDLGARRSTRAYFPFALGEHYGFEHAPEVQTFLATCNSLREALWLLDLLPYFVHPSMSSRYTIEGDRFTIYFELHDATGSLTRSPGLTETVLVVFNRVLNQLLGQHSCPEITFRHQPMTNLAAYEKQFGSRPRFGGSFDSASHPLALLDRRIPGSSPALHARMRLLLELRLKQLQELDGLEKALSSLLRHAPSMTIAEASRRAACNAGSRRPVAHLPPSRRKPGFKRLKACFPTAIWILTASLSSWVLLIAPRLPSRSRNARACRRRRTAACISAWSLGGRNQASEAKRF